MRQSIQELIEISRKFGKDKSYTIAGGGNTSFKTDEEMWVKASGFGLANISEEGFVRMDRKKLEVISSKEYSSDPFNREKEVKEDLENACIERGKRPSVETSLHNAINYSFVVHMHPYLINAVLCGNEAETTVRKLWGDQVVFVPYTDPGYVLFKKVENEISHFENQFGAVPKVIFLQNHGIFVGADTVDEVEEIYRQIMDDIIHSIPFDARSFSFSDLSFDIDRELKFPASFLRSKGLSFKSRNNILIERFSKSKEQFRKISAPFTPDVIVYCKSKYLFVDEDMQHNPSNIERAIKAFNVENGFFPKILLVQGKGLIGIGETEKQLNNALDVFEDQMKIGWFSEFFGGPHSMTPSQIAFIDTWEVENYRRKVSE
ncbi:class II aldolase/adducin family protein [Thermophagus xiamenensis]|uniref:Rhamnose utilisation protein RhaD, predicted bifunctional aldolase and dehydrogenase n=1 Tax=Thermophagus xiamenensis TaxID=385682 RepID=A0A1I2DX78_9BACT|nr:class II aldolase/adducin family protein [Thermophagus xiamenensis]SFE85244.1 Rhamnose utilisation protein RhaD, predicted bifunctional aldolase and dehydrogenase [Thermophagus xiamenensis]